MSTTVTERAAERTYFAHPMAIVESEDVGPNTMVWAFAHIMRGARLGANCKIGDHAFIETGAVLGNNVTVKNGVSIWDRVIIEDNVFLGPNCALTNDPNPRTYIKKSGEALTATLIRENATLGANATIVCGVSIGCYAFVGAGAVVIRSVPDFALVVGNPARQIGWMCVCAEKLDLSPKALAGSMVTCRHCGRLFAVTHKGLEILFEAHPSVEEVA
jgi:UDP-2-acetamido-3-amino-2,3-dideoxy-glucuronate N-acetyltransferase